MASIAQRLSQPLPGPDPVLLSGDADLNPGAIYPHAGNLIAAAVLVPLIEREAGLFVLLTQRAPHLSVHAGQISFPGGRIEPEDLDPIAAALRETHEEVGIPPSEVTILGALDPYVTATGYRINPVVGLIRPPFTLLIDASEVAEVFEIPLDFVLDSGNHQRHSREFRGRQRHFFALSYADRYIWGATAGILVNLARLLRD